MTNKVSYVYIAKDRFTRVTRQITKSTRGVRRGFRALRQEAKQTGRTMEKVSGGFSAGLKNIAAAATSFLGLKAFIQTGADFQEAIADLSAITGAAGEDLDNLTKKTLSMAKASVTSQAEVAEAIKLVASAKPDLLSNIDALTATTEQVLLLKNAAGIDLANAANITAQGLNIFGAEAKQAGEFVNILAAGAKLGSSEIADTGDAMLIAGPAARAAGLSFGQLNAAIQTVAKGGIKGARAGTALNAILGRLRRQGIDFQKEGLEGAFEKVRKRLDSVKNSTKRAQLESKIFGEEHSKVGLAILANTRLLGQYERSLVGTNIAQEQADIRLNTFNARMRKLGIVVKDVIIKTFLRLEPLISAQVANFTAFMDQLQPEQVEGFAESLKGLVEVAAFIIDTFKVVASVFKGVGTAIGELVAQIATLNFSDKLGTNIRDAFSIGGKLFGIIEPAVAEGTKAAGEISQNEIQQNLSMTERSQTDINVRLRAPQGAVEAISKKTTGRTAGLNVGVSMATAQ